MSKNLTPTTSYKPNPAFREQAQLKPKGHYFEEFELGQTFLHHWGRTLSASENALFSTLTLSFNPLYFNAEYARQDGREAVVVNPMLVFNTVFGLSVEDLSELGGAFLGVDDLSYHADVLVGDTLTARSTVLSKRPSDKPADLAIVSWHTEGFNQRGERVIDFVRTNLVARQPRKEAA